MRKWIIMLLTVITCSVLVAGCSLPTSAPTYIKDVVEYEEGTDGIVVYFVLADKNGAETTASGTVYLKIVQEESGYLTETTITTLYETSLYISKSDFYKVTVGMGAFERERIIYNFGRITYDQFDRYPSGDFASGKVIIEFTTASGLVLEGETSIFF